MPELVRDFVHQRFQGEGGLGTGGRAHRAEIHLVGVDRQPFEVQVGNFVGTGQYEGGHRGEAGSAAGKRPRVEDYAPLQRGQGAIPLGGGAQGGMARVAGIAVLQIFCRRDQDAHRATACFQGQQRGEGFRAQQQLGAETAA